jgi:hypothetical protein
MKLVFTVFFFSMAEVFWNIMRNLQEDINSEIRSRDSISLNVLYQNFQCDVQKILANSTNNSCFTAKMI